MADKELKDWCKTCDVEPPAMKFKCPECEHNPDKEQITCDCKYCMENPTCYKELLEEQLARKTQECEKLEDFRTLAREVFTFGDSDVDDENLLNI